MAGSSFLYALAIQYGHRRLLGHDGYGVTELRTFDPKPLVAYTDNDEVTVLLALERNGSTSGIYIGVQPRPLELFDKAPNSWAPVAQDFHP